MLESIKYYQALKSLVDEYALEALAVKCYTTYMGKVCLGYSLLAEEGIVSSCEGDVTSALTMKLLYELTEEQKNTVVKVGRYGTIVVLVLTLPGVLLMCLGLFFMITQPTLFSESAYKGFQILGGIIIFISLGIIAFIKIKFPYYSDKVANYIIKSRKNK